MDDFSGNGTFTPITLRSKTVASNPIVSAGNYLTLVEAGMSETAALRVHKQWDDKCAELSNLRRAAQDVIDRWETPAWKDAAPTAEVINRLKSLVKRG